MTSIINYCTTRILVQFSCLLIKVEKGNWMVLKINSPYLAVSHNMEKVTIIHHVAESLVTSMGADADLVILSSLLIFTSSL